MTNGSDGKLGLARNSMWGRVRQIVGDKVGEINVRATRRLSGSEPEQVELQLLRNTPHHGRLPIFAGALRPRHERQNGELQGADCAA